MANEPEKIQKSNESHEAHFLRKLNAGGFRDEPERLEGGHRNPRLRKKKSNKKSAQP
jgi:hypothetical protein